LLLFFPAGRRVADLESIRGFHARWDPATSAYDSLVSVRVSAPAVPRSLVWGADLDVLPVDRVVERRDGYLVIRSPSNPMHYWGNLLLFDTPPVAGDGARWEERFDREFGSDSRLQHLTFGWDHVDGALGSAREEFVARGYKLEENVGLVATRNGVRSHPRENREVRVRALRPAVGGDEDLWDQVVALQVAARDERFDEESHRVFSRRRLEDLRTLFRLGRGAWYVALDAGGGEVVASCGVVVAGGRGRFQSVDTKAAHQRRGICSRLVVEAAHRTAEQYGAQRFVIAADASYHALGLYESLGFERLERVCGVCQQPSEPARTSEPL
jgi:ribosomal protein S18 acetylase RimI-like enzyme